MFGLFKNPEPQPLADDEFFTQIRSGQVPDAEAVEAKASEIQALRDRLAELELPTCGCVFTGIGGDSRKCMIHGPNNIIRQLRAQVEQLTAERDEALAAAQKPA